MMNLKRKKYHKIKLNEMPFFLGDSIFKYGAVGATAVNTSACDGKLGARAIDI